MESTALANIPELRGIDLAVAQPIIDAFMPHYNAALALAQECPSKHVVFLGVGFETTAPTVAWSICCAARDGIDNYFVLCAHKTMPRAMEALVKDQQVKMLPVGQMMALLSDKRMGVTVKHIHVRRGNQASLSTLPEWLPVLRTPLQDSLALNLRLDEAEATSDNSVHPKRRKTNESVRQAPHHDARLERG